MRYSMLFGKTLREKPRNADAVSHQLLIRGGFVKAAASGAGFSLLPLAARVLTKLRGAIEAEFEGVAAQRVQLPNGSRPASEAARDLRFLRRDIALEYPWADQHENALACLEGALKLSYRELPMTLAAERWACRNEARASWGLLLASEFALDAVYLFGSSQADLEGRSQELERALERFAGRIGLQFSWVRSHGGATRELVITTELPARPLLACDACGWVADLYEAESRAPEWPQEREPGEARSVYGPGLINVEPLSQFLGIPVHQTTKTLLFQSGDRVVAACVAGVYDVSETKLARWLGVRGLTLAPAELVRELTKAEVGYAGPIGLPESVEVVWDHSTDHRTNFEAGANRTDHHLINLNFGRDVPRPERFVDIRVSRPGERCAHCDGGLLTACNGIAVGHVSRIGAAYSERLGASFVTPDKSTAPLHIGCGGVDVTACLAAVAEQHHDERGLSWPAAIAPFAAHLVSLPPAETEAEQFYERLRAAGVDVLWDDRVESAGVKFSDADLIGAPVRLVLSKRTGGKVEWKLRTAERGELIALEDAIARLSGADILARTTSSSGEAQ